MLLPRCPLKQPIQNKHNNEPQHVISNNVVCASSKGSDQPVRMCEKQRLRPACAYAQSDQSLCQSLEYSMNIKLLTEHYLEFPSHKGGCTGSSESTLVKMQHFGNHMSRLILLCASRLLIKYSNQ